MSGSRNKNAWLWVAIAAFAFASVARAENGTHSARSYSHPVLEFLAKSQIQNPATKSGCRAVRPAGVEPADECAGSLCRHWHVDGILPQFFIGLVSPLTLAWVVSARCLGRAPAAPLLFKLFQRPPPSLA